MLRNWIHLLPEVWSPFQGKICCISPLACSVPISCNIPVARWKSDFKVGKAYTIGTNQHGWDLLGWRQCQLDCVHVHWQGRLQALLHAIEAQGKWRSSHMGCPLTSRELSSVCTTEHRRKQEFLLGVNCWVWWGFLGRQEFRLLLGGLTCYMLG